MEPRCGRAAGRQLSAAPGHGGRTVVLLRDAVDSTPGAACAALLRAHAVDQPGNSRAGSKENAGNHNYFL